MFDAFDMTGCVRVEIVSTLLAGRPSAVEQAVFRVHFAGGDIEEHVVDFAGTDPIWETLDAHVRALNAFLAKQA